MANRAQESGPLKLRRQAVKEVKHPFLEEVFFVLFFSLTFEKIFRGTQSLTEKNLIMKRRVELKNASKCIEILVLKDLGISSAIFCL
jgi:hypothetical protein